MSKDKFANKLQTKFAGISFYIFIKKKKKHLLAMHYSDHELENKKNILYYFST